MKKNNLIYILLLFAFGCTKKTNITLPSKAGELVVNCLYNAGEPLHIYMTKTVYPKDTIYKQADPNLIVTLNEDGKFKEIINFNSSTGIYESTTLPSAAHKYQLQIQNAVNKPIDVALENQMPTSFKLKNISFKDSVISNGANYFGELKFTIVDGVGFDYYKILLSYFNNGTQNYIPILEYNNTDLVFDDDSTFIENSARYFSDRAFKNNQHEFIIRIPSGNYYTNGRNNLLIESASLSNEYFLYLKSLKDYDKAYNPRNPLANPVQLYSNSSNNLGIFAGQILNKDTIL